MDGFVSLIKFLQLHQFYLSLPINEKEKMRRFGGYLSKDELLWANFSRASLLWVIAANAIPMGEKEFAKKMLFRALEMTRCPKDLCYIHSNLAQIYQDEGCTETGSFHCYQAFSTGYYNKWAVDTLINNLINTKKLEEAKNFCQSILDNEIYRKDRTKYRQILSLIEYLLNMAVQDHLLPQTH